MWHSSCTAPEPHNGQVLDESRNNGVSNLTKLLNGKFVVAGAEFDESRPASYRCSRPATGRYSEWASRSSLVEQLADRMTGEIGSVGGLESDIG
jgi:hypothetical protein